MPQHVWRAVDIRMFLHTGCRRNEIMSLRSENPIRHYLEPFFLLHFTEYPEYAHMCPKEIGMATGALEKVSSSDVSKRFGFYYDEAMTHPLAVERNGAVRVVMLPAAEYERLARLDHVALLPSELEPADLRAIRDAEVPASAQELNHLLD
jgi:PHD/YefM family antitoxin component YafN of YafNO toxin-antitoxin module